MILADVIRVRYNNYGWWLTLHEGELIHFINFVSLSELCLFVRYKVVKVGHLLIL